MILIFDRKQEEQKSFIGGKNVIFSLEYKLTLDENEKSLVEHYRPKESFGYFSYNDYSLDFKYSQLIIGGSFENDSVSVVLELEQEITKAAELFEKHLYVAAGYKGKSELEIGLEDEDYEDE